MRVLENVSWKKVNDKYQLTTDLNDCSGVKYRFYVSDDMENSGTIEKEIAGNNDNTFTFDKKWNNVFVYGKEVNDFHTLHKQKLFTLNFSATQELIRKVEQLETIFNNQQKEITKLKLGK